MLFCERCGQCSHISDDHFIEYAQIQGTETRYLDADTGEVVDYGDTNTEGGDSSEYECPYCNSSSIDFDWEGEEEEATELRSTYDRERRRRLKEREKEALAESIRESEWDFATNEAHS